jgi:hypothetical protein
MNKEKDIIKSFAEHKYEKLISYSADEVSSQLSFKDGLRLAYRLLYNDKWDEEPQRYAVELLYSLRKRYTEQWNASWEYDALLGLACYTQTS